MSSSNNSTLNENISEEKNGSKDYTDKKVIRVGTRKSEVNQFTSLIRRLNHARLYLSFLKKPVQLIELSFFIVILNKILFFFQLALVQTNHVISSLQKLYPQQKFEIRKCPN